jgi:hypothetical protein
MTQRLKLSLGIMLLLVGGITYLLFRPRTLLMFHVADYLVLSPIIDRIREGMTNVWFPEFIVYSLPGALWSAAYLLTADCFLNGQTIKTRLAITSIIPLIGAASELLQLTGVLPGTYDGWDLLCYLIPYLIYLSCITKNKLIWL